MIKSISKSPHQEFIFIALMSIVCFSLSIFRVLYTQSSMYLFLNWNLFLAFIPWVITFYQKKKNPTKTASVILLLVWLLFFPNSPYILTDLFHLRHETHVPIWFDLVLVLSFAWTGLLMGLLSLWELEQVLKKYFTPKKVFVIISFLLFLSGFGIYLGRFLRWNSWDIVQQPQHLAFDIIDRFIHPFHHPQTWAVTILMGLFLHMIYFSFQLVRKNIE